ncbi:hypothetical protein NC653_011214 [Populus alba x Populus x berolinensis]|uniref:Uncharacterized protein n=1 Tax=Populus alba x Populus x berolinensis TaxID=444605 RepID=A0AAD6R1Y7_9ROSI|nr:hypothetical protein NC653_011214 [Populus alba x Populus x berolinensis]
MPVSGVHDGCKRGRSNDICERESAGEWGRISKRVESWGGASVLVFFSSPLGVASWLDKYGVYLGFSVCSSFKIPPSLHMVGGYRNLYTCYSRKYYNNYCRDYLL